MTGTIINDKNLTIFLVCKVWQGLHAYFRLDIDLFTILLLLSSIWLYRVCQGAAEINKKTTFQIVFLFIVQCHVLLVDLQCHIDKENETL